MERSTRGLIRGLAIALGGVMLGGVMFGAAALSPASAQQAPTIAPGPFDITVTATILGASAPIDADATAVTTNQGNYTHGVVVTWNGSADVVLDDERFTQHVSAQVGAGDLVIAGRGCGADWSDAEAQVTHICTADYQVVEVSPGESHEYPVTIYPVVGPLLLEPGTYVIDQVVNWWTPGAEAQQEQATVRLTYQVQEAGTQGTFVPAPAASGVTMATWTGGPASDLPQADSFWVTVDGQWVPYVPTAPAFAQADFMALFPGEIPAGTVILVVR